MKTILITGGARGIGRGCVDYFLQTGWHVAAVDLQGAPEDARLAWFEGDVALEETAEAAVRGTVDRFGQLDALLNNAGISLLGTTPPEQLALDAWNQVLAVNLTGTFLMAKHAAPHLRGTRGAIINIASTRANMSEPMSEAYAASKGGIVALTHALAVSLGPEIRVNCISPGWIETRPDAVHSEVDRQQHPVGRVGTPRDIAELVHYLVNATFLTGQNVVLDGGMTKRMIYAE